MSTKISWTQETWNPLAGCSKVSPGCENCYALRMSWRLMHIPAMKERYAGVVKKTEGGNLNWTGVIRLNENVLSKPNEFTKPTMFFVNSMSDIFHKEVPFEYVDRIFFVMSICPKHIFQLLTKREERMLEYYQRKEAGHGDKIPGWPLKNVWQGISVEDAERKIRIKYLKKTSAVVKFVSMEPLLGKLGDLNLEGIDQVIVGGESGPNARPMHPDWVLNIQTHCKEQNIAFFFKQWGAWTPFMEMDQMPFWTDCSSGDTHDGHQMDCIKPLNGEPGKYLGGTWMDVMDSFMYNEQKRSNTNVSYLKLKNNPNDHLLFSAEWKEYPKIEKQS